LPATTQPSKLHPSRPRILILIDALFSPRLSRYTQTEDAEKDLEIFEKLMAFDDEGLARRAVAQSALKPKEIAPLIELDNPWDYFKASLRHSNRSGGEIRNWSFPIDAEAEGVGLTWRRDIDDDKKLEVYRRVIAGLGSYEARAEICKRP